MMPTIRTLSLFGDSKSTKLGPLLSFQSNLSQRQSQNSSRMQQDALDPEPSNAVNSNGLAKPSKEGQMRASGGVQQLRDIFKSTQEFNEYVTSVATDEKLIRKFDETKAKQ